MLRRIELLVEWLIISRVVSMCNRVNERYEAGLQLLKQGVYLPGRHTRLILIKQGIIRMIAVSEVLGNLTVQPDCML